VIKRQPAVVDAVTRTTTTDGHKYLAVRRLIRRLYSACRKTQFLSTPPAFVAPVWVTLFELHQNLWRRKIWSSWTTVWRCWRDHILAIFGTMPACDGQTVECGHIPRLQCCMGKNNSRVIYFTS